MFYVIPKTINTNNFVQPKTYMTNVVCFNMCNLCSKTTFEVEKTEKEEGYFSRNFVKTKFNISVSHYIF